MKRFIQLAGPAVAVVVGSMLYGIDASARSPSGAWNCQNHTESSGEQAHNDGRGSVWVSSPDGEHVEWGDDICTQAHTLTFS